MRTPIVKTSIINAVRPLVRVESLNPEKGDKKISSVYVLLPCRVRIVSVSCRTRRELVGRVVFVVVGIPPVIGRDPVSILSGGRRVSVMGLFVLSRVIVIVRGRFVSRIVVVMRGRNGLVPFHITVRFYVFVPWVFTRARGRRRF